MLIALFIAVYMSVGAVIGYRALRQVLKELEEGDDHDNYLLEKTEKLINKIGLEAFLLAMLVVFSIFWLPLILHAVLTNKK